MISVRMSFDVDLDNQAGILHAKEMMVQATAFDEEGSASSGFSGEGTSIDETQAAEKGPTVREGT